jgi:hypothetical protein
MTLGKSVKNDSNEVWDLRRRLSGLAAEEARVGAQIMDLESEILAGADDYSKKLGELASSCARGETEVGGNQIVMVDLEGNNKILQDRIDGLRGLLPDPGASDLEKRLIAAKYQYVTLKK